MDTISTSNRITLATMRAMTIDDIAALPPAVLRDLSNDLGQAKKLVAADADKLSLALDAKYGRRATALRRDAGKDTGIVRVDDGEFVVICELQKRVDWNQSALEDLGNRIQDAGENPRDYIDTKLSVPEARYNALPPHLRQPFDAARTVKPGKPGYAIEARKE